MSSNHHIQSKLCILLAHLHQEEPPWQLNHQPAGHKLAVLSSTEPLVLNLISRITLHIVPIMLMFIKAVPPQYVLKVRLYNLIQCTEVMEMGTDISRDPWVKLASLDDQICTGPACFRSNAIPLGLLTKLISIIRLTEAKKIVRLGILPPLQPKLEDTWIRNARVMRVGESGHYCTRKMLSSRGADAGGTFQHSFSDFSWPPLTVRMSATSPDPCWTRRQLRHDCMRTHKL